MNIEKIYREFDGHFSACEGKDCKDSCCKKSTKEGIDIFPDEVVFLLKKYGKNLPVSIEYLPSAFTGFVLKNCSKENTCILGKNKTIFCRCYPVRPYRLFGSKYKLELHDSCPLVHKVEQEFYSKSAHLWMKVLSSKWSRCFLKKWWARWWMWRSKL